LCGTRIANMGAACGSLNTVVLPITVAFAIRAI